MKLKVSAGSDPGKQRPDNQDFFCMDPELGLFAVADGLGGRNGGAVASRLAIETVQNMVGLRLPKLEEGPVQGGGYPREPILRLIREAIQGACSEVFDRAKQDADLAGMGTTLTVLLLHRGRGYVGHVGDTRAILVRKEKANRLTDDHRVVDELVKQGMVSLEEAKVFPYKGALSRAVGIQETVQVDLLDTEVLKGDRFVICSDGLHQYQEGEEPFGDLKDSSPEEAVGALVTFANQAGGSDNITVVVVDVVDLGDQPGVVLATDACPQVEWVRRAPLFCLLDYRELVSLLTISQIRDFQAGEEIVREGDPCEELYVILYGAVKAMRGGTFFEGPAFRAWVGEEGMNGGDSECIFSLVAEEVTRTYRVDHKALAEMMGREPFLANKLLRAATGSLIAKLQAVTERLAMVPSVGTKETLGEDSRLGSKERTSLPVAGHGEGGETEG